MIRAEYETESQFQIVRGESMNVTKGYRTRQRRLILSYIAKNRDRHITAEDIMEHSRNDGDSVGKSTVYRYLNVLLERGVIRKYFVRKGSTACYRYVEDIPKKVVYHLKCHLCGKNQDVECEALDIATQQLWQNNQFKLDSIQTLLYGECGSCIRQK